ncbi:MAG TPA: cytochrome d ubiquinol oxidase subunit II, partial [Solirubrobacteraceae bacterium]|nr:cytochrome d ubiquinol oxidase subunit II [Solirubrobacteraceae bacterium]
AGGAILFPSLAALFGLVLRGHFDPGAATVPPHTPTAKGIVAASARGLLTRTAAALLIAGFGLLTVADAGWAHAIGVACLLAFVVVAFLAVAPTELAAHDDAL